MVLDLVARRGPSPRARRPRGADAGRDPEAVDAAYAKYRPQGRQERRLHSGAGQGRSQAVRHRPRDRRRQGLHRRRCQDRSLDPVDLKVFTMAKVIQEQGPDAIEKQIGVDATGMRFNSIVASKRSHGGPGAPEMNPLVNPGRDRGHQHGHGRDRATRSGRRSSASTTTSPAGRSRATRTSTSPSPTPTSATRPSAR